MDAVVEDAPEGTRERILAWTWTLLENSPGLKVRIADIAAAAGVSRQAVYLHFGNRANLLLAAVRHRDLTTDATRGFVEAALRDPLPGALAAFVAEWFGYIPRIQPVARLLSAASQVDADARLAWEDRMSSFRGLARALVERLAEAGLLRPGWSVEAAADWVWHRTHLDAWRHLVHERGWDPSELARRVSASLERDLLISGAD